MLKPMFYLFLDAQVITGRHSCVPDVAPWLRSSLYPIMDQLGDLPVNDQVQGAMKATGPTGGRKTPRV